MNILLVKLKEPESARQKSVYMPPIGLWSIRANLKKQMAIEVDICDEHIGDKIEVYLKRKDYLYIGISAQFSIQHKEYLRVAKIAKRTGAIVIAGGTHAALTPILKAVDSVCIGSGEDYDLITNTKTGLQMADYELPIFSSKEINQYWLKNRPHDLISKTVNWLPIETSRGCVRNCNYCATRKYWGKYKTYSLNWIENYLWYLEGHKVQELFIEDDNIATDLERFKKLIKIFNRCEMYWSAPNGIEINKVSESIEELKGSTCWRLSLPFETGLEKTADLMNLGNKWIIFKKAKKVVLQLKDIGIQTCGFFIIGYPGETLDDMKRTLEYANKLPLDDRHIYIATPYPGTRLYDLCRERGYIDHKYYYQNLLYSKCMINTEDFFAYQVEELRENDRKSAIKRKKSVGKNI